MIAYDRDGWGDNSGRRRRMLGAGLNPETGNPLTSEEKKSHAKKLKKRILPVKKGIRSIQRDSILGL